MYSKRSALIFSICAIALANYFWVDYLAPWRFIENTVICVAYTLVMILLIYIGRKKIVLLFGAFAGLSCIALGNYYLYSLHKDTSLPPLEPYLAPNMSAEEFMSPSTDNNRQTLLHLLRGQPPKEELIKHANSYLNYKHKYYSFPEYTLQEDYDWSYNPSGDPSWAWVLHNMSYVATLTRAYEITDDKKYIKRAQELVLDWIRDNSTYLYAPPSEFSWNDHSTAFRLLNWLYFYEKWEQSPYFSPQNSKTIFRSILGHAKLLSSNSFYTENHNHGIDQDRALIAFTLMHPEIKLSKQWSELAKERIKKQFLFSESINGVHLEHLRWSNRSVQPS